MDIYSKIAWVIPLFPLVSFLILTALGKGFRIAGIWIGSLCSLAALLLSLLVLIARLKPNAVDYHYSFDWITVGRYTISIGYEVTNLTALMLVVVTLVHFMVNVYSAGYMSGDERLTVFYSYVSLFAFSMLGLVLSDNMLSFYIFWELVGACSFLLIGFWYARPAARAAAKKAFIVTRIGDASLLAAILLLFWYMPEHTLTFTMIQSVFEGHGGSMTHGITTLIALLIFFGAAGKSGQFPLHVWLPDAMEGPTPISALIHAATMVAAGVFLVARTFDIFEASAAALDTAAYVGSFTALFAATIALAQNDIKRILAYSTISQLGYMMAALGFGSLTGAVFHLLVHAFFKALLFLGAGSVIHAVHTHNIQEMGGLGSRMRVTAWTFAIGALALAGIPPLAGFWSKDVILTAAIADNPLLFVVLLAAAFCTAMYMTRLFTLVFLGGSRLSAAQLGQIKESPAVMTLPLIGAAALTIVSGFVETPWNGWLGSWLNGEPSEPHSSGIAIALSISAALLGILAGWTMYGKATSRRLERAPMLIKLARNGYYVNELYEAVFVRMLRWLGAALAAVDSTIVGGAVRLAGATANAAGRLALRLQNGQAQTYSLAAVLGIVMIILAVIGRRLLL